MSERYVEATAENYTAQGIGPYKWVDTSGLSSGTKVMNQGIVGTSFRLKVEHPVDSEPLKTETKSYATKEEADAAWGK